MNIRFVSLAWLSALALFGCAQTGFANDVSSLAGVYSSAHPITISGIKVLTHGYIEIDRSGRITAFEQEGEGPTSPGSGCYRLSAGTATNAGLQGRILTPGLSPRSDSVYQTLAGDSDTFGILADQSADGNMHWFFHWGMKNSTVTINGNRNVVNAAHGASYSISGPALASPTPDQLQDMVCHADNEPATAASVGATASQPSAISVPPALEKAVEQASLQRLGLTPGSRKADILLHRGEKIATDPDIRQLLLGDSPSVPGTATPPDAATKAQAIISGLLTLTPDERSRMTELSVKILDGVPADCGGVKNLPLIMNRYAISTLPADDLEDYLGLMFKALKQSARHAPLAHVTDEEHRQGEQAVMNQLGSLLKKDPDGAHDLAELVVNSQAMTPTQWCHAMRLSERALTETPQPFRDWATIERTEAIQHQAALTLGTATPAPSPTPTPQPDFSHGYTSR